MPAKTHIPQPKLNEALKELGSRIYKRRKELKLSSVTTSEAAGLSRMTLNRIEKGESSVTIGAYLKVLAVLGLSLEIIDKNQTANQLPEFPLEPNSKISLSKYPQLKSLAWQLKDTKDLNPNEALDLYERNWRHLDLKKMKPEERDLIQQLLKLKKRKKLLV